MKILVINTGSSSIKYQLFDMDRQKALSSGLAEKIGESTGKLTHIKHVEKETGLTKVIKETIPDHRKGLLKIVNLLLDSKYGSIKEKSEIRAIGHRVVHGGEKFQAPAIIDRGVITAIKKNIPLAPLHNPSNLTGIEVAKTIFPDSLQVAVFDTAFHQSIPPKAYLYALPYELYKKHKVRRYGFHGTSHGYVAQKAADYLSKPLSELNMITIHLGNGASMAALKNGRCVDTTMGMTPLEGLVMGTRCGDIDPALPFFLANHLKMSLKEIDDLVNKDSGLKGICGTNDMREVIEKKNAGEPRAKNALEIYCYRIKKYIGAYFAVLESLDCLVFTGGIGENAQDIRALCCQGLTKLGIKIDINKNKSRGDMGNKTIQINSSDNEVNILVVPTNEELKIALETKELIDSRSRLET
ncbi:MAG: acetate kinase [Deltaproteobacteria bacterium]|nr:acetate kinase [Deltaproteobacteria bacterium]